jgi:hypothetical protein
MGTVLVHQPNALIPYWLVAPIDLAAQIGTLSKSVRFLRSHPCSKKGRSKTALSQNAILMYTAAHSKAGAAESFEKDNGLTCGVG